MAAKLRSKSAPQLTRSGLRSSSAATVISDETKDRIDSDLYAFSDEMYDNESRGLAPLFTRQKTIERDLDPFSSMDDDMPSLSLKQISVDKNRQKLKNLDSLYAKGKSKKRSKGGKKKRRKTRGGGKSIDFSQINYDEWADNELGNEFGGVFNYGKGRSKVYSPKNKKKKKVKNSYVKQGKDDAGDFVSMGGKRKRRRKTRKRKRRRGGERQLTAKDVAKHSRKMQNRTTKNPTNKCAFLQTPVTNLKPESFQENKLKRTLSLRNMLVNENCTHLLNEFTKKSNNAMMSLSSQQHGGRKRRRSRRKRSKRKRKSRKRR